MRTHLSGLSVPPSASTDSAGGVGLTTSFARGEAWVRARVHAPEWERARAVDAGQRGVWGRISRGERIFSASRDVRNLNRSGGGCQVCRRTLE